GEREANILRTRCFQDFRQWRQMTESFVAESELAELDAGTDQAYFDRVRSFLDLAVEAAQADSLKRAVETQALISKELAQQVLAVGEILLVCLGTAVVIPNLVLRPLRAMLARFEDMAQGSGDLTARLQVNSQDEVGQVGRAFNQFMEKLHKLMADTAQLTSDLGQAAMELAATARQTSVR